MTMPRDPLYAGYRYYAEFISNAVWLYFQFRLRRRMIEERLDARGISVTYETIRQWGLKKPERAPRLLITDKLCSYAAAKRKIMPGAEHRQHKGLNNRAENFHQPTRRRERIMTRFRSLRQAQRFLSTREQITNFFSRRRNQNTAAKFHAALRRTLTTWAEATGVEMAA